MSLAPNVSGKSFAEPIRLPLLFQFKSCSASPRRFQLDEDTAWARAVRSSCREQPRSPAWTTRCRQEKQSERGCFASTADPSAWLCRWSLVPLWSTPFNAKCHDQIKQLQKAVCSRFLPDQQSFACRSDRPNLPSPISCRRKSQVAEGSRQSLCHHLETVCSQTVLKEIQLQNSASWTAWNEPLDDAYSKPYFFAAATRSSSVVGYGPGLKSLANPPDETTFEVLNGERKQSTAFGLLYNTDDLRAVWRLLSLKRRLAFILVNEYSKGQAKYIQTRSSQLSCSNRTRQSMLDILVLALANLKICAAYIRLSNDEPASS